MVDPFVSFHPVRIFFGEGRMDELKGILKEYGFSSAIIVADPIFADFSKELAKKNSEIKAVFSGIEPNPQLKGAVMSAALAKKYNADVIIAIGGGSSIDTAKMAAAAVSEKTNAKDIFDGRALPIFAERLPIIAVPTTAGTGSEVTQVTVINDGDEKKTIGHPAFMPLACIVDPVLTYSLPKRQTMLTGLDALSHALEGFWSVHHQPLTDLYAIEGVKTILRNLESAYADGSDRDARNGMAFGALLAGLSFAQAKTAGCHACSYPLSMQYHLSHGEACAFTLDSFVMINGSKRLDDLCERVGLSGASELAEKIRHLKRLAGLRMTADDLGITDFDALAESCEKHPLMKNNPVKMSKNDIKQMFLRLK